MAGPFRCGFVSLIGRPNVGKSTLLNRILGQKIAITSHKPQTTRNRIAGIHNLPEAQIVFLDTPGLHEPKKPLNRKMVREARNAAQESDVAAMLIEATSAWQNDDRLTLDFLAALPVPKFLVINKVDLCPRENLLPLIALADRHKVFAEIIPLSAKTGENVDRFCEVALKYLPEGPALFPEDVITDQAERFWAAEIIREKITRKTHQELPYATAVLIEEWKEEAGLIRISAVILVERDSQKPILIGKGGQLLKEIGTQARKEIESFLGQKVFLSLFVRVQEKWWDDPDTARELGFKT